MDPRRRKKMGKRYFLFLYVCVLCVYVRRKGERRGGNFDANDSNNDPRSSFVSVAALSFPDDGGEKKRKRKKDAAILLECTRENVGRVSLVFVSP